MNARALALVSVLKTKIPGFESLCPRMRRNCSRRRRSRHRWHRHSGLQRRLHLPEDRPQDSPLFWNYLTFSDGLLTVYEVAREFEFNSLRHAVWQVGHYRQNHEIRIADQDHP